MFMKKKTVQLNICRKENVVCFFLLFLFSIVIGCFVYGCFSKLFLGDDKTTPDFFMNWYNTKKTSYKQKPAFDTIVLIDADNLNRMDLAEMLFKLDSMQPKVIGFDILLEEKRDYEADSRLFEVFQQCHSNIVFPVYVDDKDSLRAPFFKNNSQNDFYYGSVVFDNPWESRTKQGDYSSFAYLIAKLYLGKEIDTTSFIVDYTPITLNERIYYDKVACSFLYLDKQKPEKQKPNLRGKIVLIGTLDRTSDAVNMRFPVRYEQSSKPQYVIPGMISLSYEIRSMVDEGHRIKKMDKLWSFVLNITLVVMYLLLYICFRRVNLSNRYLRFIMPLIGLAFILFLEWLLVMFTFFITDQFGQMPNLGLFMATIPVVKTADEIVSRYLEFKLKTNNNKSN